MVEESPKKKLKKCLAESPAPQLVPHPARIPREPRQMSEQRDSSSDFAPLRFLGKGAFGAVVLVQHKVSGERYATKVMSKRTLVTASLQETARVEQWL